MKRLTIMLKPASSLCDMRCGYCFYSDVAASRQIASMGVMKRETADSVINNVYADLEPGDFVNFAFQGGEPGLAGLGFFEHFTAEARKAAEPGVETRYAIQTNGLMIDGAWCDFFKANDFLVGLSLDGDMALHNQNRMDRNGKGTFKRVMDAKKTMDQSGVEYNILCVLTAESSRRASRIWDFIIREDIRHIQFIPCLESLEGTPHPAALTGERFYRFYTALYPLWENEANKNNIINVRLFEDIAGIFLAGRGVTCGISGRCSPQIVVEADGGAYPCDFYMIDKYRISDLTRFSLREVFEAVVSSGFLADMPPPPPLCGACAHNQWCGGGCKRMARAVYGENCGMKMFLDERLDSLLAVAAKIYQ